MKVKAAVVRDAGKDWEIAELELDPPRDGEVLVRFVAAGLCPSDEHVRSGDLPVRLPIVGGHEGAGVVEQVGRGVTRVKPGDHVVCSSLPVCGHCRFCSRGLSNLCELGALLPGGTMPDGSYRFHGDTDFGQSFMLGTFAERAVIPEVSCLRVDDDLPLEVVALMGCAVPAGWGAAVCAGGVRPGDVTLIYGLGGTGINGVQGAAAVGARAVVGVDPVARKREVAASVGATHTVADAAAAHELVLELTGGTGADQAVVTVAPESEDIVTNAFRAIRRGGTVVVSGLSAPGKKTIHLPAFELTTAEKRIVGSVFGSGNPFDVIPQMLDLYRAGRLRVDDLITGRYELADIARGYRDLQNGHHIRGIIVHDR